MGTLITDNLTDNFGVPLTTSTILFAAALAVVFATRYLVERTLSIHSIVTIRREVFYWLSILFTFALGTSSGDLVAERFAIGHFWSAAMFANLIALITVAHLTFGLDTVLAFWAAYIFTRPLGASMGDLISQNQVDGGLGIAKLKVSVVFPLAIAALIGCPTRTRVDVTENLRDGEPDTLLNIASMARRSDPDPVS